MIAGNVIGGILKNPDTIILVDEDGDEFTTAMTGEEVELTADVHDIRLGKTAALTGGVKTGEKYIPSYHTLEGIEVIPPGGALKMYLYSDLCQFTKLQALICAFNTSLYDSVATEKVSIDGKTYAANSAAPLSEVAVDLDNQAIDLTLMNDSENDVVIRYFTYKEVY